MNLLPIGNHISSVLGFERDLGQIVTKVEAFDDKLKRLNEKDI